MGCQCLLKLALATCEKKFPLIVPGSVFKDYEVHHGQTLAERFETWTTFPYTSGLQNSPGYGL